jgi:hypothetical protein
MKTSVKLLSSVAAFCMLAAFSPASAVTMQAVYKGFISSSTDLTNIFGLGLGAGVLDNQEYTLTFLYNPTLLGVINETTSTLITAHGGPLDMPFSKSPFYGADLVINGITKHIGSNGAGNVSNSSPLTNYNSTFHSTRNQSYNSNFIVDDYVSGGIGGLSLGVPFDLQSPYQVVVATLISVGQFDFSVYDDSISGYSVQTFGSLSAKELTVSIVPLPGTLPFFVAGLIGLGAVSRKRAKCQSSKA